VDVFGTTRQPPLSVPAVLMPVASTAVGLLYVTKIVYADRFAALLMETET